MSRLQRGFTLVEVMVVVTVISVLAAIALASMQEYAIRTKVSEAILAMSACRTTVSEIYQGAGSSAPGANGWGCESGVQSKYVSKLETDADGAVTVTVTGVSSAVDGGMITLIPLNGTGVPATVAADMGSAVRSWNCGGTGTTANPRYLPATCRGGL
jgi:type IV pilus assembly protein PilA